MCPVISDELKFWKSCAVRDEQLARVYVEYFISQLTRIPIKQPGFHEMSDLYRLVKQPGLVEKKKKHVPN